MASTTRSKRFINHLDESLRRSFEELADLEDRLGQLCEQVHSAWPTIAVSDEIFIAHLANCVAAEAPEGLTQVHGSDLYLACACGSNDEQAVALFEEHYYEIIKAAAARIAPGDKVEEVLQRVVTKLFVGEADKPAKINTYHGRGTLRAWTQAVTIREAYGLHRTRRRRERNEMGLLLERAVDVQHDPELVHLKEEYRQHFKEAFQQALAELDIQDRNLIRFEYLDGLNLQELGAVFGVSRATAARWRSTASIVRQNP